LILDTLNPATAWEAEMISIKPARTTRRRVRRQAVDLRNELLSKVPGGSEQVGPNY
jgi:hypothetical protein